MGMTFSVLCVKERKEGDEAVSNLTKEIGQQGRTASHDSKAGQQTLFTGGPTYEPTTISTGAGLSSNLFGYSVNG